MFSPYLLLVNLELMVVNCLAPRHKGICGKLTGIQFGQLFPGIDIYLASYLIEAIAIAVVSLPVFPAPGAEAIQPTTGHTPKTA